MALAKITLHVEVPDDMPTSNSQMVAAFAHRTLRNTIPKPRGRQSQRGWGTIQAHVRPEYEVELET